MLDTQTVELDHPVKRAFSDYIHYLDTSQVPVHTPGIFESRSYYIERNGNGDKYVEMRGKVTNYGMWALVDLEWTKMLSDWIGDRTVLEVMAGAGYLARALLHHGKYVIATDNYSWDGQHKKLRRRGLPIRKFDAINAIKSFNADVLVMSWPPYGNMISCHVGEAWGPDKPLVYIGEQGGCNAPDEFFYHYQIDESVPDFPMRSWSGIWDRVYVGYYQ